jgi:protein-S-isoprenylcysteine O-methyltransferase Ste14
MSEPLRPFGRLHVLVVATLGCVALVVATTNSLWAWVGCVVAATAGLWAAILAYRDLRGSLPKRVRRTGDHGRA